MIVFVSKMMTLNRKQINERGLGFGSEGESTVIGFARIFSGKIKRDQ